LRAQRQGIDSNSIGKKQRVSREIKRTRVAFECLDGRCDIRRFSDFVRGDIEAELVGRCLDLAHF
jgi:hypothetical protein